MKVVLKNDIKNLGKSGDIKEVADGYALNFLIPRGLVETATGGAVKKAEMAKEKKEEKEAEKIKNIEELQGKISTKNITIKSKEKGGKLFGSIGKKEIASELSKQGIVIEEKMIALDIPIKEIGEKEVVVNLGHGKEAKLKISVEKE